jgi:hypothetical protein
MTDYDYTEELEQLGVMINRIARAIYPMGAVDGKDAAGGCVSSLTEAAMGITAGLCNVADGLHDIAEAIRERQP